MYVCIFTLKVGKSTIPTLCVSLSLVFTVLTSLLISWGWTFIHTTLFYWLSFKLHQAHLRRASRETRALNFNCNWIYVENCNYIYRYILLTDAQTEALLLVQQVQVCTCLMGCFLVTITSQWKNGSRCRMSLHYFMPSHYPWFWFWLLELGIPYSRCALLRTIPNTLRPTLNF
jgi:hypothetical protein